jgi:hypothetical protein
LAPPLLAHAPSGALAPVLDAALVWPCPRHGLEVRVASHGPPRPRVGVRASLVAAVVVQSR